MLGREATRLQASTLFLVMATELEEFELDLYGIKPVTPLAKESAKTPPPNAHAQKYRDLVTENAALSQMRAVWLKTYRFERQQKANMFIQLCVPMAAVLWIVGFTFLFFVLERFLSGLVSFDFGDSWGDPISLEQGCPATAGASPNNCFYERLLFTDNLSPVPAGTRPQTGAGSGFLGAYEHGPYAFSNNASVVQSPAWDEFASRRVMQRYIYEQDRERELARSLDSGDEFPADDTTYLVPLAAVEFRRLSGAGADPELEYTLHSNEFSTVVLDSAGFPYDYPGDRLLMKITHQLATRLASYSGGASWSLAHHYMPLARDEIDFASIIGFIALPAYVLALQIALPSMVFSIVKEKEERLLELQRMLGLPMRIYYLVAALWNSAVYLVVVFLFVSVGAAARIRVFTQGFAVILPVLLTWGGAQISMAFFYSSIMQSAVLSAVVLNLGVFVGAIVGLSLGEAPAW